MSVSEMNETTGAVHDARRDDPPGIVNLRRLFLLRNIAIAGQALAVGIVFFVLHISLPLAPMAAVIAALAALNAATWIRLRAGRPVSDKEFFFQLAADAAALTGLLYFSGGATNPFVSFFLLPLAITATVLPQGYTWAMAALTAACYTLLMVFHVPLPESTMRGSGFGLHVFGMWLGFMLSAGLIAYFVVRMADTLRERDRLLAAAREQALRDERLIALAALAAGAAHELGTPLGTMAIVTKDLEREYAERGDDELTGRLRLLREQVDRCKEALSTISASAGEIRAESGQLMPLDGYLEEVMRSWRGLRPGISLDYRLQGTQPAPRIIAERTLSQALINILNNAADASPGNVELDARWDDRALVIEVCDRGPGLSPTVSESAGRTVFSTKAQGLGLGLFLVHAVIGRLGGRVTLFNREGGGACTRVVLPLSRLYMESPS